MGAAVVPEVRGQKWLLDTERPLSIRQSTQIAWWKMSTPRPASLKWTTRRGSELVSDLIDRPRSM
jgi:hypothetical protein